MRSTERLADLQNRLDILIFHASLCRLFAGDPILQSIAELKGLINQIKENQRKQMKRVWVNHRVCGY